MTKNEIIAFILRQKYAQELTYKELADRGGIHVNTLKNMNHNLSCRLATAIDVLNALGYELEIKEKK